MRTLATTISTLAALALAAPALAGTADPATQTRAAHAPPPGGSLHHLLNTTIDYGVGGTTLSPGFNTIDSTTVTCPSSAGCTITFGLMMQAGSQTAAGNKWAICAYVDGATANPGGGCPYQNELPTDSAYQVGNSRQNLAVSAGTHTVTAQVYVTSSATLGEWEADYSVSKP